MSLADAAIRSRQLVEIGPICEMAAIPMPKGVTAHDLALHALDHVIEASALGYHNAVTVSELRRHLANRVLALSPTTSQEEASSIASKVIGRLRNETANGSGFPFEAEVLGESGGTELHVFQYVRVATVGSGPATRPALVPEDAAMRLVLAALDPFELGAVNLQAKAAERAVRAGRLAEATMRAAAMRRAMIGQSDTIREIEHRLTVAPDGITRRDVESLAEAMEVVAEWHVLAKQLRTVLRHGLDALLQRSSNTALVLEQASALRREVEAAFTFASSVNAMAQRVFREAGSVATENVFRAEAVEGIDLAGAVLPAVLMARMDRILEFAERQGAIFGNPTVPICCDPNATIPRMIENFKEQIRREVETVFEDEPSSAEAVVDPSARAEELAAIAREWLLSVLARYGQTSLSHLVEVADMDGVSGEVLRWAGLHVILSVGEDDHDRALQATAWFEGSVDLAAFTGDEIEMRVLEMEVAHAA